MSGCAHMDPQDVCASCAPTKLAALRQRVEELEREKAVLTGELPGKLRGAQALADEKVRCFFVRAEAAEVENEELRAKLVGMLERAAKAEAEVERLREVRYADDLGIARDAAGLSTRCHELRDRLLAQSAEMKNALEAIEMLQATLVARDETVERLRAALEEEAQFHEAQMGFFSPGGGEGYNHHFRRAERIRAALRGGGE